jgi:hypothetical protein
VAGAAGSSGSAGEGEVVVVTVSGGSDDVNEDGSSFQTSDLAVWAGNGASEDGSFAGLRFNNVQVPVGATVTQARLELFDKDGQAQPFAVRIALEADANCKVFTPGLRPSARIPTVASVSHVADGPWIAGVYNLLDDIKAPVQEVINRPAWAPGNSLCVIVKGTGAPLARRNGVSFEGGNAFAPRLSIRFVVPNP